MKVLNKLLSKFLLVIYLVAQRSTKLDVSAGARSKIFEVLLKD